MNPKTFLAVFATALLLAGPAAAGKPRRIEETRPLSAGGTLIVENVSGRVRLAAGSEAKVVVRGRLGAAVESLELSGDASRLRMEVVNGEERSGDNSADLEIVAPKDARIEVETVSADIDLEGFAGELYLRTTSGELELRRVSPKSLRLRTISGDVEVDEARRAEIETVSGSIEIDRAEGELEVRTVSGDVRIGGGTLTRLRAKSVSGDVEARAKLDGGDLEIESHSGDVVLRFEAGSSVTLRVSSYSGEIEQNGDVDTGRRPSRELKVGAGAGRGRVTTFSGDVRIL